MKTPNAVAGRVTSSGENQDLDPGRILRVGSNAALTVSIIDVSLPPVRLVLFKIDEGIVRFFKLLVPKLFVRQVARLYTMLNQEAKDRIHNTSPMCLI